MLRQYKKNIITIYLLIFSSFLHAQWIKKDTVINNEKFNLYPINKRKCCTHSVQYAKLGDKTCNDLLTDGKWIQFFLEDPNRIAKKFAIKDSLLNGLWTEYYWNQQIERVGEYIDGRKSGKWTEFDDQGNMKDQSFYLRGSANGESWTFYKNGDIESEGFFINNSRDSIWTFYYENGKLKYQLYYDDGKILNDSVFFFHDNGNRMIVSALKDGLFCGEWTYFYPNSNIKTKGNFIIANMDVCAGGMPWKTYYSLKEGSWKYYYESGEKLAEIEYKIIKRLRPRKSKIHNLWIDKSKVKREKYYDRKGQRVSKNYIFEKGLINKEDIKKGVQHAL